MAFRLDFPSSVAGGETPLTARAAGAVEAVIEAGAARLIAEPWRASRIIRGAEHLSLQSLSAEVARRRALRPPADFNRALALAQLARALERPAFALAWARQRGAEARTCVSGSYLSSPVARSETGEGDCASARSRGRPESGDLS